MGVLGGLFTSHNDFHAQPQFIDDSDLAKRGFQTGVDQGPAGESFQQANMAGNLNLPASQLGLQGVRTGFGQAQNADASQAALANQLALRAAGKAGPSIAEQQLAQSLGQVQQQGAGSLAAARGVSPGTAARLIGANQTTAAQTAAGQGAILRSQEQQAAENQLANVNAMRAQSGLGQAQVGFGGFGAGQNAALQGANVLGGLQQTQNRTAAGLSMANQQSQMDAQRINANVAQGNTNANNQAGGGLMNAAGGALAALAMMNKGGEVGVDGQHAAPSLAEHLMASHRHLSSAHEHIAKFAAGGEVHDSYKFEPLNVRAPESQDYGSGLDVRQPKGETGAERQARQGTEEKDARRDAGTAADMDELARASEDKVQHKAEGGEVEDEDLTPFERRLRDRQAVRDRERDEQTQRDMDALGGASAADQDAHARATRPAEANVKHYAGGGEIDFGPHYDLTPMDPHAGEYNGGKPENPMPLSQSKGTGDQPEVGDSTSNGAGDALAKAADFGQSGNVGYSLSGGHFGGGDAAATGLGSDLGAGDAMASFGMAASGGQVPGHAKVAGNSLKNDTVPTMLSPGEVVLPRTVSHDPDAAADFVRHINARRKMAQGGEVKGFGHVLAKQRELHNRLSALEKKLGGK